MIHDFVNEHKEEIESRNVSPETLDQMCEIFLDLAEEEDLWYLDNVDQFARNLLLYIYMPNCQTYYQYAHARMFLYEIIKVYNEDTKDHIIKEYKRAYGDMVNRIYYDFNDKMSWEMPEELQIEKFINDMDYFISIIKKYAYCKDMLIEIEHDQI